MLEEWIDINGTPHHSQTDFKPIARRTKNRYFILASRDGIIFNPNNPTLKLTDRDGKRGDLLFKLQSCTKECYESYKLFLKTKNRTHFIVAERRFLNG